MTIKSAILSTRVVPELFEEADKVAREAGQKRGDFIEEAIKEKIDRTKNPGLHLVKPPEDLRVIPETSGKHREIVLASIKEAPATKFELAQRLRWEDLWISPRLTELKKAGLIVANGKRINPKSGASCAVWRVK